MNSDIGLMQIIAVGKSLDIDYLQHLVDMYDRERIKNKDKMYVFSAISVIKLFAMLYQSDIKLEIG